MILGIDPGLSGGLGIYDGQIMFVADLPTFGTGTQRAVDCSALADIVRARGADLGERWAPCAACWGLFIPIHLVSPSRWKKTLGLTADEGRAAAERSSCGLNLPAI